MNKIKMIIKAIELIIKHGRIAMVTIHPSKKKNFDELAIHLLGWDPEEFATKMTQAIKYRALMIDDGIISKVNDILREE